MIQFSQALHRVLSVQAQPRNGGGLHASIGSSNTINATNTTFAANTASSGGAVFVTGASTGSSSYGSFNCAGCAFTGNAAAQSGGAVMATGSMQLKLSSSEAASNAAAAGDGGAVLCLGCQLLVINASSLTNNTAVWGRGGGCSCLDCKHVAVNHLAAMNNTAAAGGALWLSLTGSSSSSQAQKASAAAGPPFGVDVITSSKFEANTATIGDCSSSRSATCSGTDVQRAGAAGGVGFLGSGGAVQLQTAGPFAIKGSSFTRNSAASDGGEAESGAAFARANSRDVAYLQLCCM